MLTYYLRVYFSIIFSVASFLAFWSSEVFSFLHPSFLRVNLLNQLRTFGVRYFNGVGFESWENVWSVRVITNLAAVLRIAVLEWDDRIRQRGHPPRRDDSTLLFCAIPQCVFAAYVPALMR